MVKLVFVVHRRAGMSAEAFRERWLVHGQLVKELAPAMRARKYVQSHTVDTEMNAVLAQSRGLSAPFDGITEVWWDSIEDIGAAAATPDGKAAFKRLIEDERAFVDFTRSSFFVTKEYPVFER